MKTKGFLQRKRRTRAKIFGEKDFPRLSVFRSNKYIYAQLIDDANGQTLAFASSKELKGKNGRLEVSGEVGENLAKRALAKKIKKVKFDRSGYRYHGRVAALAEGARKGGLTF